MLLISSTGLTKVIQLSALFEGTTAELHSMNPPDHKHKPLFTNHVEVWNKELLSTDTVECWCTAETNVSTLTVHHHLLIHYTV